MWMTRGHSNCLEYNFLRKSEKDNMHNCIEQYLLIFYMFFEYPSSFHAYQKKKKIGNNFPFLTAWGVLKFWLIISSLLSLCSISGWNGKPEDHRKRSKARRRLRILTTSLRQRNPVPTSKFLLREEGVTVVLESESRGIDLAISWVQRTGMGSNAGSKMNSLSLLNLWVSSQQW